MTKKELFAIRNIVYTEYNKTYKKLSFIQEQMRNTAKLYSKCEIYSDKLQADLNKLNSAFIENAAVTAVLNNILEQINNL